MCRDAAKPYCDTTTGCCGSSDEHSDMCSKAFGARFSVDGTCKKGRCGLTAGFSVCSSADSPYCNAITGLCGNSDADSSACEASDGAQFSLGGSCQAGRCGGGFGACADAAYPFCNPSTGFCGATKEHQAACENMNGATVSYAGVCSATEMEAVMGMSKVLNSVSGQDGWNRLVEGAPQVASGLSAVEKAGPTAGSSASSEGLDSRVVIPAAAGGAALVAFAALAVVGYRRRKARQGDDVAY
jgi:hypothetical protein